MEAACNFKEEASNQGEEVVGQSEVAASELAPVLAKVGGLQRLCCLQRVGRLAAPNLGGLAVQLTHRPRTRPCPSLQLAHTVVFWAILGSATVNSPKPRLFPVDPAARLATTMAGSVTPKIFEVDRVVHSTAARRGNRVADFLHTPRDREAASNVLKHLRHEQHVVQCAVLVEGCQDLGRGQDLNNVTGPQWPVASSRHD